MGVRGVIFIYKIRVIFCNIKSPLVVIIILTVYILRTSFIVAIKMIFKSFCFLFLFVQIVYSSSILEARIKNFSESLEEEISSTVSEACPEGWIESLEGCFYFHHTGEEDRYVCKC